MLLQARHVLHIGEIRTRFTNPPRNRAPAPYRGPQDLEWSIQPPRAFRKLIEMCTATERTMRPTAAELCTRALELRDGVLSDMNKEEGMGDVVSKTGWLL